MHPLLWLINTAIDLYSMVIYAWVILGLLLYFKIANRTHPLVYQLNYALNRMVLPALRPIRRYLPDMGGVDISPIILLILLHFTQYSLFYYF